MNWLAWLAMVVTFQAIHQANAKAVFAHFMVTNSENYTASDWQSDFKLAQDAHIDAFALNMAWEDKTNDASVAMAFTAAEAKGFRLFFSFDYAGNGPWDQDAVTSMIQKYSSSSSYFQYNGKPFFYTNLPGYNKNWLWNSGSLWHDRWQELYALDPMPEFVEIISWNDYGESHYIGPIRENALAALDIGEAPFDFVAGYPHDAWRDMLPFLIDLYKTGSASMGNGLATFWYTPNPLDYCSVGGTTLNTASQLQIEYNPKEKLEARIWVMSLFSDGNTAVFVNGESVEWDFIPDGSVGAAIRFGSVAAPIGMVEVNLIVHDAVMQLTKTIDITTSCDGGFNNFNAWVGSVGGGSPYGDIYSTLVDIKDQECVQGKGAYDFNALCNFTCSYGYCPVGACTCEQMGAARSKPKATGTTGYPAEGKDANYVGLCSFACNYGYCPSATCDTTEHPMPVPTVSDFLPPACVALSQGQMGYWSKVFASAKKTRRTIPLPVLPASTSATECVVADDYIQWDDVNDDIPDVTGQVHFGDSFAAGMGTGNTPTAQKCRVGSNNFGQLLHDSFVGGFDYQNLACSGDTVAGLYDKLHGWQNPTVDSLATMTIGGNDLDFSNIVKHCILRYFRALVGWDAAWCSHYKSAAKSLMADTGADGLQYRFTSIYLRIIGWAQQNPDFNLYVAGYPRFFNADTTQCNDVSFRYWGWDKVDHSDVWLTTSLRTEMNDLVTSLNKVIEAAVLDANNLVGRNVTHFVDVDPSFEGHRWCEPGVIEPDPSHMSTAFFLSGWSDIEEGATVATAADDSADLSVLQASGSLPLPDGNTCNTTLGVDPDPVDVYWCDIASAVASDPDGDIATQVALANTALASGDFTAQDVSRFLPTRQIKTFHPRSIGMAFYRDAILAARQQVEYGY
ncbi:hypothetical protein PENARI_c040G05131 [Penicillium arizonense]|uniref:SGNH hydrolase-type esterase domain-containing protein n=1 Tax=Penicillium arizonense TaxID=1835702 RepID=A0A1F5L315_PENAI|nr:hypothetical protein PENARI_c040G05131 [Penicillium arizonense]OGE47618.1 hypothetical protein PENARI_c040G05131 [Penicillium arizonense]